MVEIGLFLADHELIVLNQLVCLELFFLNLIFHNEINLAFESRDFSDGDRQHRAVFLFEIPKEIGIRYDELDYRFVLNRVNLEREKPCLNGDLGNIVLIFQKVDNFRPFFFLCF